MKKIIHRMMKMCGLPMRPMPNGGWLKVRRPGTNGLGFDPFDDMKLFTAEAAPIVFDVGANVGQTVFELRERFPQAEIHSFEPGEATFKTLTKKTKHLTHLHLVNAGLGARRESKTFVENELSDMSSFLEPGSAGWGAVTRRSSVQIDTVDDYCERHQIDRIHILKSDTQGYDLEVLRGTGRMLAAKKVDLIYLEINLADLYQGLPRFDEIYAFLADHGMELVTFYDMHYRENRLYWTDAMFRSIS